MKQRFTKEQIIHMLREAEMKKCAISDLCRQHGISEQTFYRWRNRYGGVATLGMGGIYYALKALVEGSDINSNGPIAIFLNGVSGKFRLGEFKGDEDGGLKSQPCRSREYSGGQLPPQSGRQQRHNR